MRDTIDVSVRNGAIVIRPSRPSYSLAHQIVTASPTLKFIVFEVTRPK